MQIRGRSFWSGHCLIGRPRGRASRQTLAKALSRVAAAIGCILIGTCEAASSLKSRKIARPSGVFLCDESKSGLVKVSDPRQELRPRSPAIADDKHQSPNPKHERN